MNQLPNAALAPKPPMQTETAHLPGTLSLEALREVARAHAPILCFASEHDMVPGNVDWYLEKSWLVNAMAASRLPARNNTKPLHDGAGYYLQLKEGVIRENYKIVPRAYVRAIERDNDCTDFQYWFFFTHSTASLSTLRWLIDDIKGHEASLNLFPLGTCEGTWEHVTVRVNHQSGEAEAIYFPDVNGGTWVKAAEAKRLRKQVVVYVSGNMNIFFPDKHPRVFKHWSFDIQSSRLELAEEHRLGDNRSCDFSLFSDLLSVSYLPDVEEPAWLSYNHYWGQPKPDYLTQTNVKQILHHALGKKFDFLLSRDVLNDLSSHVLQQHVHRYLKKSISPACHPCWEKGDPL